MAGGSGVEARFEGYAEIPLVQLRQGRRFLRRGDSLLALERRSGNPQLLHLVDECSALQAKFCGRSFWAADDPTDFPQGLQNQSALRLLQSSGRRRNPNTRNPCRWQRIGKHAIFRKNYGTFNKVLELADVPGPQVGVECTHR